MAGTHIAIISGTGTQPVYQTAKKKPRVSTNEIAVQQLIALLRKYSGARIAGALAITADSVPDFDNWGWDEYWSCGEWMEWHRLNVTKYGVQTANQKFIQAWGSQDAFMAPYNWCKYHSDFANYFKAQGIDVGWLLSHLVVTTDNVTDDVLDTVTDTSSGVRTIGSILKTALPFIAVAGGVVAVDKFLYPLPEKTRNYLLGGIAVVGVGYGLVKSSGGGAISGKKKMSKEDAILEAEKMGVDFNLDFHEQTFPNELAELAQKTGYRKPVNANGSTARYFFYHLLKLKHKLK